MPLLRLLRSSERGECLPGVARAKKQNAAFPRRFGDRRVCAVYALLRTARRQESDLRHARVFRIGHDCGDLLVLRGLVGLDLQFRLRRALGGHAVCAVGYNDKEKRFLVRNSWGPGWGIGGYFKMPYAYLSDRNLSDDFWTIRRGGQF